MLIYWGTYGLYAHKNSQQICSPNKQVLKIACERETGIFWKLIKKPDTPNSIIIYTFVTTERFIFREKIFILMSH